MKIEIAAEDRKQGLTLAEIQQFINRCELLGVDPRSSVTVVTGFRSQIQKIATRDAPPTR
jgi:hypothetical protein